MLDDNSSFEQRAAVGALAAQLEIAKRLEGIENSIGLDILVRNE